jgi:hypothetical protein
MHDNSTRTRAESPPSINILGRTIRMPRSRMLRVGIGGLLVFFGIFGFLPVVGFWMIPAGLFVLSYDIAAVRRWRRRVSVWWERRKAPKRPG